jgi:sodium/hydrogen antiporter
MTSPQLDLFLLTVALIGVVIVISALLSGLIEKSGLPQVAVFLGLGALIGPGGLNLVDANVHSQMLRVVGTLSLVLVLFTDAVSLNLKEVRKERRLAALMIGPGALLSAAVIGFIGWKILGLSGPEACVLGAALASTDPVLLRGLTRRDGVKAKVKQALRLEGGMNDAVLLPVVLVGVALWQHGRSLTGLEWGHLLLNVLLLSPAAGVIIGLGAIGALNMIRKSVGVRRDYESIYSLGVAFAAFAGAEAVHGSGFLAAFAAGLTISSLDVELCDCFLEYGETTAEMSLMFAFVLFGTSVIWSGLGIITPTTILFTVAVFLARPAAFIPALLPTRLAWKDRALIAWFGPRGLSSLLLVLLPVIMGVPNSESLVPITCLVVLCSVVLHGFSPNLLIRSNEKALPILQEVKKVEEPEHKPASELIEIAELIALKNSPDERVILVDARRERSFDENGELIPGALRLNPDEALIPQTRSLALPRTGTLAIFCDCPNEETSSRVTRQLRNAGWPNARAVVGGWKALLNAGVPHQPQIVA